MNLHGLKTRQLFGLIALFFCVVSLSGCDDDTIDINDAYYENGGHGTNATSGALVFRVHVKGVFNDFDRAEFRVFPGGGRRVLERSGRHDVDFLFLEEGYYDYSIEEWLWDNGVSTSTGFTFGSSGGWSTTSTTYYGGPSYDREYLDGTVYVEAGRTVFIDVEL